MQSADASTRLAFKVMSSGSPGPAPTRYTFRFSTFSSCGAASSCSIAAAVEKRAGAALEQHFGDTTSQLGGLGALACRGVTDHAASIWREDRAGQEKLRIVEAPERADRNLAAAAEFLQHGALRRDRQACPGIVERRAGIVSGSAFQRLDRERTLAHHGTHDVGTEGFADDFAPAEPLESRGCEHDGVILASFDFVDARVDVAADRADVEIRPQPFQLRDASKRTRADHGARLQIAQLAADDRVVRFSPLRDGSEREAFGQLSRQVLHAVDREIDAAIENGLFNFLGEKPFAADLVERGVLN